MSDKSATYVMGHYEACYALQRARVIRLDAENRHLREELATWESVRLAMAERIGEAEEQNREMRDLLERLVAEPYYFDYDEIRAARAWLAAHPEEGEHATK